MRAGLNYPSDFQPEAQPRLDEQLRQPAYAEKGREAGLRPSHFVLLCGCLMLILTVIVPVWESNRLMQDPAFVYFVGREYCLWIILICGCAILAYALMVAGLFSCGRSEAKTQHSVFGIATTVVTMLGLALLLLSQPLRYDSRAAYEELFFHCGTGRSQKLTEYAAVLQGLRSQPDCAKRHSVEDCDGYHESHPYTGFLKQLEASYMCTGFCYGNGSMVMAVMPIVNGSQQAPATVAKAGVAPAAASAKEAAAAAAAPVAERAAASVSAKEGAAPSAAKKAGLVQSPAAAKEGLGVASQVLAARLQQMEGSASLLQAQGAGSQARSAVMQVYPPSLFTGANYQTSCDGAAARALRYKAMDSANLFYFEGVTLVVSAIAVMLLQVAGMCSNVQLLWLAKPRGHRAPPAAASRRWSFSALG